MWLGTVSVSASAMNGKCGTTLLKLDKQYKKDANEAKIYIDGIKARQTTRRTLTPSYVFNVCIIHAHEHDVIYVNGIVTQMYDRQPCAGYIKRLTRVP